MSSFKKVLVTGATGLIGKELILPLKEKNFEIFAITIDKNIHNDDVTWINENLFEEENIKSIIEDIKPEYLLNMAWCTTEDYLISNLNYKFLNTGKYLLKYFKENGGKRTIFAGTCFEYKNKNGILKEIDDIEPKTIYAKCKNELRIFASNYCKENNISFGWGRIFNVFGYGEHPKRLTPYIINSLKDNKKVIINNPNIIRDYMYSKEIARAFVSFLDSQITGIVNICTGKGISLKEYALEIAKLLNKTNLLIFNNEGLNKEPSVIIGDNHRLYNEICFTERYNIKSALEEILNNK